jgi:hypothetical protein
MFVQKALSSFQKSLLMPCLVLWFPQVLGLSRPHPHPHRHCGPHVREVGALYGTRESDNQDIPQLSATPRASPAS